MAVEDYVSSDGGAESRKWNSAMATFVPRDPVAFKEIDVALHGIAEAAARAGTAEDADWSQVHRAIFEAYRLIDELS